MSDTVIRVENLGKKYVIGHKQERQQYTALRDVIANGAKGLGNRFIRPKNRTQNSTSEDFWALKDVSFEIKQGDRVGIIGRNGAGKSTLLKILSRITEPTEGRISIKGRVASLLEVGTGFHPELTGRENISLNGAILGMSKVDIRRKFDEIVAFAEVEKFLDTPVKRYSSGMYVRLAFSVAAHLEPEILIVDEVLAVGDVKFQNKCLGKMGEVSRDGRTVLFVSHNIGAVQHLCDKGIFLQQGNVKSTDSIDEVVKHYLRSSLSQDSRKIARKEGNGKVAFDNFFASDSLGQPTNIFSMGDDLYIVFSLVFEQKLDEIVVGIRIRNHLNEQLAHIVNRDDNFHIESSDGSSNKKTVSVKIPELLLSPSEYLISLWVGENMSTVCDHINDCMTIELIQGNFLKRTTPYPSHVKVFLKSEWREISEVH